MCVCVVVVEHGHLPLLRGTSEEVVHYQFCHVICD